MSTNTTPSSVFQFIYFGNKPASRPFSSSFLNHNIGQHHVYLGVSAAVVHIRTLKHLTQSHHAVPYGLAPPLVTAHAEIIHLSLAQMPDPPIHPVSSSPLVPPPPPLLSSYVLLSAPSTSHMNANVNSVVATTMHITPPLSMPGYVDTPAHRSGRRAM